MGNIIDIKFRVAVKAFLVCNGKLLLIRRADEDIQSPGIWEIPGGRLELGEDPILGLIRELREETGLYVRPILPLSVRHFIRKDDQIITMLIFFCKLSGGDLKLSEEHNSFDWIDVDTCKEKLNSFFHKEVDVYRKLNLHNLIDF